MIRRPRIFRWLTTRVYLALGLASLTVTLLLVAAYLGLVPDGEAQSRQHRSELAQSVAVIASGMLDESQPEGLRALLGVIQGRTRDLRSIGVRADSGQLLIDINGHAAKWVPGARTHSTDSEVVVPVWQQGQPWGEIEFGFKPLRSGQWWGELQDPLMQLSAFMFACGVLVFMFYLKRMLRHLDPARTIPSRVRYALDSLTEGLLVLDADGVIMLANQSLSDVLGTDSDALIGQSAANIAWVLRRRQPAAARTAAVGNRHTRRADPAQRPVAGHRRVGSAVDLSRQLHADSRPDRQAAGGAGQPAGCDRARATGRRLAGGKGRGRQRQPGEEPVSGQHEP